MKEKNCYFLNFKACSRSRSPFYGKECPGREACKSYISEEAYFEGMVNGTIKEDEPTEEEKAENRKRVVKALTQEKSKKQKKREEKLKAEANKVEGGYRLGDDPAFRDLFSKNNKKN